MTENLSLEILLAFLGATFVLIGILGGNFEVYGIRVPQVISDSRLRFVAIVFGVILLLVALRSESGVPTVENGTDPTSTLTPISQSSLVISSGEKILVKHEADQSDCIANSSDFETKKKIGTDYMLEAVNSSNPDEKKEDYETAYSIFNEAIELCDNAPETYIYRENARIGSKGSYTIAVPVPITENSTSGQIEPGRALMMLRGFAQAQKQINQSPDLINGKYLKLLIVDDKDDKNIADDIAKELSGKDDVVAVMGHWRSDVSESAAGVYREQNLVLITPISIYESLSKYYPWVFRINATSEKGASALGDYVRLQSQLNDKKVLIFFDSSNPYSDELRIKFKSDIKASRTLGEIDLLKSSEQENLKLIRKAADEEHILAFFPGPQAVSIALNILQQNASSASLILGDMANLYIDRTLNITESEGMILAPSWNIDSAPDSYFTRKSRQLWGGRDVNWSAAMSYNAAQALIQAIKKSSGTTNIRLGIKEALIDKDFSFSDDVSSVSELKFSDRGVAETQVQLVKVCPATQGSNSKLKFKPLDLC